MQRAGVGITRGHALATLLALSGLLVGTPSALASPSYFAKVAETMTAPRLGPVAAPLPDGQVLIAGGYNDENGYLSGAELFNPTSETFASVTATMQSVRFDAGSAPLPDGQVLIASGETGGGELSSGELFAPVAETFASVTGAMKTPRFGAAAAPLPDGEVLIVGGYSRTVSNELASAELFDPATGTFADVSEAMKTARLNPIAVSLPNGEVLIAGGHDGSSWLSSAELFDPATDTFVSLAESMTTPRVGAVAALLPDGEVLIAGGYNGSWLSSAELFDPATDKFVSLAESMTTPREAAVATPLPDGRVLIAGGYAGGPRFSSAEIFYPAAQVASAGGQFGDQTVATSSLAQLISISNVGAQLLKISSASLEGTDTGDFKIEDDGCEGVTLAFRQSCTIAVQFTPTAEGDDQTSIGLVDNAPEPATIKLTGKGIPANSGPAGPKGNTGAAGTNGPAGAPGAAGAVVLVTCNTVTKAIDAHGLKRYTHARKCTRVGDAGEVTLGGQSAAARARLLRGGQVYALGTALLLRDGGVKLMLSKQHALQPGRYTLVLLRRHGGHWITTRQEVTIG